MIPNGTASEARFTQLCTKYTQWIDSWHTAIHLCRSLLGYQFIGLHKSLDLVSINASMLEDVATLWRPS